MKSAAVRYRRHVPDRRLFGGSEGPAVPVLWFPRVVRLSRPARAVTICL